MFDIHCRNCEYKGTIESVAEIVWAWTCPACGSKRPPEIYTHWRDLDKIKSSYNQSLPQSDEESNDLTTWPAWRKNEHRSE